VGHYTDQLIRYFDALSPEYDYTYYYGYFSRKILHGSGHAHRMREMLFKIPGLKSGLRAAVDALARTDRAGFDLYFEPNFIPSQVRARKIVTTVHDFSFHRFPETHPKDRIAHFQKRFLTNVKRSNRIITVSTYVKTEAMEFLRVPSEIVTPIHLGVDRGTFKIYDRRSLDRWKGELGLPENFILFIGTREPRKNLKRLLEAYLQLPASIKKEFKLLLIGPRGWNDESESARGKLGDRVITMGYLEPAKLAYVYNLAKLFVFPSVYEGFGLPPLEAMACGCPAVVSNVSSLPEVCGEAAYYVDPEDPSTIAAGICKVLEGVELRQALISKGLERAAGFSWERTAGETLAVFRDVLAN
jgi:glycosyltransferase involved in cell wall biosynthesis